MTDKVVKLSVVKRQRAKAARLNELEAFWLWMPRGDEITEMNRASVLRNLQRDKAKLQSRMERYRNNGTTADISKKTG
jgi:hypothetical protein